MRLHDAKARTEWERIYDRANEVRHDPAVERAIEAECRRAGAGRRGSPRAASGGRRSLAAQFRGLFLDNGGSGNQDVWFDASYSAIDGVSGKVASLIDYIDPTHVIAQSTSANQSAAIAANAAFGNALTLPFTGLERYDSNRALARWAFTSAGTGSTVWVVLRRTADGSTAPNICSTQSGNSNGFTLRWLGQTTPNNAQSLVISAPSGNVVVNASATNALLLNTATYLSFSYVEAASPEYNLRSKSTSAASGLSASAPDPGNPFGALSVGNSPGSTAATSAGIFDLRALYALRRAASSAEHVIFQQWIQKDTGILP